MKRFISLLILLVLLTGCAKPPEPVQNPPAPPVITLWHSYQGSALKGLVQAQENLAKTNPPYQLQLVYVSPDNFWTNLTRTIAAGKGPDLFLAPQDQLPVLYAQGSIQALNNLFSSGNYFKSSIDALSFNGSVLAVPQSIRVPLLAYNRDLVPTPPTSLEQLVEQTTTLTHGQAIGLTGDISNPYLCQQIYSAYGAQLFAPDQKPNFTGPETLAFLQEVTALLGIKAGAYSPVDAKSALTGGTTPFGLMDAGELNAYKATGKNLGFMEVPGPGGKEGKPYVKAQGFALSVNCNFPKQAVEIAEYLAAQQAMSLYSIPQGEFPAVPGAYDQKPLKDKPEAQLVKRLASIGNGYPLDSRSNLLLPILNQAIKDCLSGIAPNVAAQNAQNKALHALGYDKP